VTEHGATRFPITILQHIVEMEQASRERLPAIIIAQFSYRSLMIHTIFCLSPTLSDKQRG
jgi:hypothetical protein